METSTLNERLKTAVGERSYRDLGHLTGIPPETVRRYMLGHSPSAEFLAAVCGALSVNGEWLLTGRGPMHKREIRTFALREANVTELLNAMSATLERLIERVERLELYLHTMEARLRARQSPAFNEVDCPNAPAAPPPSTRAQSLSDAIAKRPPPDAH